MCPKCCNRFSICKLLNQRLDELIFDPILYLGASHEVFGLTLFITWVLTLFFPDQIHEHQARPIISSYNPCLGWDYPPGSYIALVMCSVNVYLTWRYALLDQVRTRLLGDGRLTCIEKFSTFACFFLALSSNLWLLFWLFGPNADSPKDNDGHAVRNWFIHTCIFMTYASASYLAALGHYLKVRLAPIKRGGGIELKNTVYIIVYGIVLGYLGVVYVYDLVMYEHGRPPALHPIFTKSANLIWMACLASISDYLPHEPQLKVTTEVVTAVLAADVLGAPE